MILAQARELVILRVIVPAGEVEKWTGRNPILEIWKLESEYDRLTVPDPFN